MEKLETCVYKIQVNRLAYVPSNLERCRNCTDTNMLRCNNYKAYTPASQIVINQGRNAMTNMRRLFEYD